MKEVEPMIDGEEVGRRLAIASETVMTMARQGRLPCIRLPGRLVRFRWSAIARALGLEEAQEQGGEGSHERA